MGIDVIFAARKIDLPSRNTPRSRSSDLSCVLAQNPGPDVFVDAFRRVTTVAEPLFYFLVRNVSYLKSSNENGSTYTFNGTHDGRSLNELLGGQLGEVFVLVRDLRVNGIDCERYDPRKSTSVAIECLRPEIVETRFIAIRVIRRETRVEVL